MTVKLDSVLAKKLQDPEFLKLYKEECNMCSFTLRLIQVIEPNLNEAIKLTQQKGFTTEDFQQFIQGNKCIPELANSLADSYGISPPEACTKHGEFPREKFPMNFEG